jgi:hypothetical protein
MSNREVAGLQALAQKHGGNLSVNPDTGLPEAGFLDNLLPTIAGAGISYFSGGAIDPITAGAIVGGITALDSKDLSKGLMAGLGAYGGAGMVGGLAGLGAAGADTAAMAAPEYQAAVGTGAGNFASHPIDSLSTLGGGSVLKGSLPILAGLAPAAAEAFDEEDEDKPPEQHKGYIRKYALDPVTGQYKQVGAYEAGGDPNVDVSDKAGTAGAFGGVGQSEYEAAQGMASGGATSDSSRIYDYLMGRGPNPMQFTSASRPRVDYPKPPEPITPTTPILEEVYDQYGNRTGGGNYDPERREAELNAVNDYLNVDNDGMTLNKYFDLSPEKRADLDARAAKASPIRAGIKELGTPLFARVLTGFQSLFPKPVALDQTFAPLKYDLAGNVITDSLGYPITSEGLNAAPTDGGAPPSGTSSGAGAFPGGSGAPPSGEGRTMGSGAAPSDGGAPPSGEGRTMGANAAPPGGPPSGEGRTMGANAAPPGGPPSGDGGRSGGDGPNGPAGRGEPGGDRGGWGRGGGYAHGGIANLHQYNLGSYSDGGRLLKGPGDGVSDDIPATIGHGQPARLADGEFVIPARIVSEIGNGSTDAGARELYKMMDRIQAGRKKTVGKDQVAKNSKAVRHLPA